MELRREIHEGLNVIELWNDVNDFVYFGKGGEFATNKKQSQELSVLTLHLLQNCLVYINTLMIQQILSDPEQMKYMTEEDLRGLTPLIFAHINPYGSFNLDMESRIPILSDFKEAA
jgi:TnpA family transposase